MINFKGYLSILVLAIMIFSCQKNPTQINSKTNFGNSGNISQNINSNSAKAQAQTNHLFTSIAFNPQNNILNTTVVPYELEVLIGIEAEFGSTVRIRIFLDEELLFDSILNAFPYFEYKIKENVDLGEHIVTVEVDTYCSHFYSPYTNLQQKTYKIKLENQEPPTLEVAIAGPNMLDEGEIGTWQAAVSNGDGSYSYQWYYRHGSFTWTAGGMDSPMYSHTFYNIVQNGQNASVKVVVDDGSKQVSTIHSVFVRDPDCPPNQICPQSY